MTDIWEHPSAAEYAAALRAEEERIAAELEIPRESKPTPLSMPKKKPKKKRRTK